MAWTLYHKWLEGQADGSLTNTPVDFDNDTLKVALVTGAYTPDAAVHDFWSTPQAQEVGPATNYNAGGTALGGRTVTLSSGTVTFDNSNDLTWAQSGGGFANARYAVLYKVSGNASTSPLIAYADLGGDKGNELSDLTLQFNGIITWS